MAVPDHVNNLNVTIRSAVLDDSDAIARLMTQLGYPSSGGEMEERLRGLLSHPDYMTWVAESDGKVIGVIGSCIGLNYEKNGTYGRILALVVDERLRGQGVGAILVAEAERWLKECGATSVIVNSRTQRTDAHRFYRRLGYSETGLRLVKDLA